MKSSVTRSYLDGLFASRDSTYGLPRALFLFVESLAWFAQGLRSGVWTYFEATPSVRQQEMLAALGDLAPKGFDEQYGAGMRGWAEPDQAAAVDRWLAQSDEENNAFLWRLAEQNRAMIDALLP